MERHDVTAALQRARLSEWLGDFEDARVTYRTLTRQLGTDDALLAPAVKIRLEALKGIIADAQISKTESGHLSIIGIEENEGVVRLDIRAGHPQGGFPDLHARYVPGQEWTVLYQGGTDLTDNRDLVWYEARSIDPSIHLYVAVDESGLITGTATTRSAALEQALRHIDLFLQGLMSELWAPTSSSKLSPHPQRSGDLLLWGDLLEVILLGMDTSNRRHDQPVVPARQVVYQLVQAGRIEPDTADRVLRSLHLRDVAIHAVSNINPQDLTFVSSTVSLLLEKSEAQGKAKKGKRKG